MGLILSMVHSSPAIKQVYNCEVNDAGPVRTNCLRARVQVRSFTNRLHGKAAERAVR